MMLQTKYSGADWMQSHWQQAKVTPSPLAIKVADVLGQVYKGIYHIHPYIFAKKTHWDDPNVISLSVRREIATYDGNELTLLVMACLAAGIAVEVSGSFRYCTRLTFTNSTLSKSALTEKSWAEIWHGLEAKDVEMFYQGSAPFRIQWRYTAEDLNTAFASSRVFSFDDLIEAVAIAHHTHTRIALKGFSPRSLQIHVTQRYPSGQLWRRHPDLETAMKSIEPFLECLG
jgi:hypothetical protein